MFMLYHAYTLGVKCETTNFYYALANEINKKKKLFTCYKCINKNALPFFLFLNMYVMISNAMRKLLGLILKCRCDIQAYKSAL